MPTAIAAAINLGFTVLPVNSFLGDTVCTSLTASFVISSMRREDDDRSPACASSTTVERRSSSSGWLRSMSAAISAAVNLRRSGFISANHATAAVAATQQAQRSHLTHET